jgi:hypothetical protein
MLLTLHDPACVVSGGTVAQHSTELQDPLWDALCPCRVGRLGRPHSLTAGQYARANSAVSVAGAPQRAHAVAGSSSSSSPSTGRTRSVAPVVAWTTRSQPAEPGRVPVSGSRVSGQHEREVVATRTSICSNAASVIACLPASDAFAHGSHGCGTRRASEVPNASGARVARSARSVVMTGAGSRLAAAPLRWDARGPPSRRRPCVV